MSRVADSSISPSYIELDTPIDLVGLTEWTLVAAINVPDFNATGGEMAIFARTDFVDSEQYQFSLSTKADGNIRVYLVDSFFEILDTSTPLSEDAWHWIVFRRRNSDQLNLRVDGSSVADTNTFSDTHASTGPVRIGSGGSSTTVQQPFYGKISHVMFWSRAISDVEADALMSADPTDADFWTLKGVDEVVDYGGFTTLTDHNTSFDADEPFSSHVDYTLTADSATYASTFTNAQLAYNRRLVALGGSYAETGGSATLRAARTLIAQSTSYAETPTNATLRRGLRLNAASASYSSTFADAALRYSGAPSTYTLVADPGSYAMTGSNATLRRTYAIVAASTSYAVTATPATLRAARVLVANATSYAYTPASARLALGLRLNALPASYSIAGSDAVLSKASRLVAVAGSYSWTPANATLRAGFRLVAGPAAYGWAGTPANLNYSGAGSTYTLTADPGSYAMVAANATLRANRVLFAANTFYTMNRPNAVLRANRFIHVDPTIYGLTGLDSRLALDRRIQAGTGSYACIASPSGLRVARRLPAGFTTYLSVFMNADLRASFESDLIPRTRVTARYDTITKIAALYSRVKTVQGRYQPRTAMTVNVEN